MRRILLTLVTCVLVLAAAAPAEAGWGWHRHRGYGGWGGGYRGWGGGYRSYYGGWGGYGWGGYRGYGYGPYYGGYGVSLGYYQPSYFYGGDCYYGGGYGGYYAPLPIGYYGFYGSTYNPGSNFLALSASPNLVARPATVPGAVRNLLDMSREELLAALRAPAETAKADPLPRIGGGPLVTTITAGRTSAEKPAVRWSNAEQRRKAEQHLATGDLLFGEQKFHSALQRYKLASQTAPDMAETYWRQGHALIATANFDLAGGAFKRAIALDGDIARGDFQLDELYRGAAMAKASHLESLAGWALTRGDSSEPFFLMGVQLHYDGQRERAGRFFSRAADFAGLGGEHLAAFVPVAIDSAEPDLVPSPPAAAPLVEAEPAEKADPPVPVAVAVAVEI